MRFHWVSQNQTGDHEVSGGYFWCPRTNKNGRRSPHYEMLRNVQPGDVVFCFRNKKITHIGVVVSECFEARKPNSFGKRGDGWLDLGWMLLVEYESVARSFIPSVHMDVIGPLLPGKYSPLQASGRGNQMYFTTLPDALGWQLLSLSGFSTEMLSALQEMVKPAVANSCVRINLETEAIRNLEEDAVRTRPIPETEKQALIAARVGQGAFRSAVLQIEPQCRITGVADTRFLRASHIKPWRDSADHERLDGHNGLMLTPTIDALFDGGYMTFTNSGYPRLTSIVPNAIWMSLGLSNAEKLSTGPFHAPQKEYLQYHRDVIYRR
jgi:putative restriction endonuclease